MNSNARIRYQVLPTSDRSPAIEVPLNDEAEETVAAAAQSVPSSIDNQQQQQQQQQQTNNNEGANKPLNETLPTYQDVLYQKHFEAMDSSNTNHNYPNPPPLHSSAIPAHFEAVTINLNESGSNSNNLNAEIGTDCIFMCAFMIAFLFNWVGFFAAICIMPTIASKYGALSGFGLSMAKWATIVRYQEWVVNVNDFQQKLFFWIFMLIGFYLFFRGLITYVTIKYNPSAYLRRASADWWFLK